MRRSAATLRRLAATAALLACGAQAQPPAPAPVPWVQVEVLVFRHLEPDEGGEQWPVPALPPYPADIGFLLEPGSAAHAFALREQEFALALDAEAGGASAEPPPALPRVLLPREETFLGEAAARVAAAPGYRLLAHYAWREPMPREGEARHLLLAAGASEGEHREVEGFITLQRSRYLHLDTQLWLNEFAPPDATASEGVELPAIPRPLEVTSQAVPMPGTEPVAAESPAAPQPAAEATQDVATPLVVEPARAQRVRLLSASRRLLDGEVHYIDHPAFGAIATVRTWDPAAPPGDAAAEAPPGAQPAMPAGTEPAPSAGAPR